MFSIIIDYICDYFFYPTLASLNQILSALTKAQARIYMAASGVIHYDLRIERAVNAAEKYDLIWKRHKHVVQWYYYHLYTGYTQHHKL